MKTSIIIPVLNSHRAVGRQLRYFKNMELPDDIEIIIVDDGSNPPLTSSASLGLKNLTIYPTNDKRPWTQGLARNAGAKLAKGEYLFMTDIDHILSKEAIYAVREFSGDRMDFPRYFAVLDPRGRLRQDIDILFAYGLKRSHYKTFGLRINNRHGNTFAIRKEIFFELGGYVPERCTLMMHAPVRRGEDCFFNQVWNRGVHSGIYKEQAIGPKIYMFPIGRFNETGDTNPHGLFHSLSYEPVPQPMLE